MTDELWRVVYYEYFGGKSLRKTDWLPSEEQARERAAQRQREGAVLISVVRWGHGQD